MYTATSLLPSPAESVFSLHEIGGCDNDVIIWVCEHFFTVLFYFKFTEIAKFYTAQYQLQILYTIKYYPWLRIYMFAKCYACVCTCTLFYLNKSEFRWLVVVVARSRKKAVYCNHCNHRSDCLESRVEAMSKELLLPQEDLSAAAPESSFQVLWACNNRLVHNLFSVWSLL